MGLLDYTPERRKAFKKAKSMLDQDPDYFYASMIPVKKNLKTKELSLTVPTILRDVMLGSLDLFEGVATGELTPRAIQTLPAYMSGGLVAGAPKGAVTSGFSKSIKNPKYYKNTEKNAQKLMSFLDKNNVEYSFEPAKTGSFYFNISVPDGKRISARISDHNNLSLGSRHSYDYQIYPDKNGFTGGQTVENLIDDFAKKYNYTRQYNKKTQITAKDFLGNTAPEIKKQAIIKSLNYSDDLFKDIYKVDKKTAKKLLGIE